MDAVKNPQSVVLEGALSTLTQLLHSHWRKEVILLIDEYDVPLTKAEQKGYYDEMLEFMRGLLGGALKDNPSLKFAVLTGCLRITTESIFTGVNNFACFGISDEQYATQFGFTQDEVDALLQKANRMDKRDIIKAWYDGFRFGSAEMYCPWDVLFYLYALRRNPKAELQPYWLNTSSNSIIVDILNRATDETKDIYERLMAGESIEVDLVEDFNYDQVAADSNTVWSLLYLTGYLTKTEEQSNNGLVSLRLTNHEIREIFRKKAYAWCKESLRKVNLTKHIWSKDAQKLQTEITNILWESISYHDYREDFYHGFIVGLLAKGNLVVESNHEHGYGRTDIVLKEKRKDGRIVICKFKVAKDGEKLEDLTKIALAQIENQGYAKGFERDGNTVLRLGIAFHRKDCAVQFG